MRDQILQAAMKLFLSEGFEKVTMRRIAKEIEYSPATIYLYFKDKNEILYTLHEQGFEELHKRQQAMLSIGDPLDRLKGHGFVYISFALEKPEYYDLMFIMRGPARKFMEEEWTEGRKSYEFLRRNVEECIAAGYLPEGNLDVAAFSVWSLVHGIVSLIIRGRCSMFPQEKMKAIAEGALEYSMSKVRKGQI
ncbi:MAG TPA: TetR/AcrR family transcriptional regulator [Thermodesulfovibrionales bacterium]|nr:TetR/AcrR family transcriptional regulator [Thermodesulfovibrionales bacterium]